MSTDRVFFRALLLLGALLLVPGGLEEALAHVVVTLDGTTYEGRIVSQDDEKVVIETTFDGTKTVPRDQVKSVDDATPPLRDQLAFRIESAGEDAQKLWDVHRWAKAKGFSEDLDTVLLRIIEVKPNDARAHKALGHEKIDGRWMTPEEKAAYELQQQEEEMRARGLVPYEGRWVTPEEKDALERGLIKDGDDWVTEEEYHRRRGEQLVDGEWVRLGEAEGEQWGKETAAAARIRMNYLWGPHFDVYYDVKAKLAQEVLEGAEAAYAVMRRALRPQGSDLPEVLATRQKLVLLNKLPAYAKFAQWFDKEEGCSELVPGWGRMVQKQHAFWWADPMPLTAVYKFPNVDRTFVSNVIHNMGLVLLTRYKFNYRFSSNWLREGFAYYLEMESIGYTDSFTLGRGGSTQAGQAKPVWADSDKWRAALKALVAEGRDPPLKRLADMGPDQMGYEELVKAWSVIECLVRWDGDKFKAFIDATKDRDTTEEEALRQVFGMGYRQLDRKWRAYVKADFQHL
ncbi:MAG: LSm family protein [Planctomycetota bacterium]|jgi:hypothetical protein